MARIHLHLPIYSWILAIYKRGCALTNKITKNPVEVNVSIRLFKVVDIDELGNTIDLQFEIELQWFDRRHTYNNLKWYRPFALNKTDLNRIWLPLVVYQNTDQFQTTRLGSINEWSTNVKIAKKGSFKR